MSAGVSPFLQGDNYKRYRVHSLIAILIGVLPSVVFARRDCDAGCWKGAAVQVRESKAETAQEEAERLGVSVATVYRKNPRPRCHYEKRANGRRWQILAAHLEIPETVPGVIAERLDVTRPLVVKRLKEARAKAETEGLTLDEVLAVWAADAEGMC